MRIVGAKRQHFAGWAGGVWEDSEPDLSGDSPVGVLQEAMNTVSTPGGRRAVRHGTRVVQTFSPVSGDDISDVVGIFRWSQTGAIAIAHSEDAEKHFAYALDTEAQFALPVGNASESGSRVDAGWDADIPARPLGVELFETLYVVDSTLSSNSRQPMIALTLQSNALVAATPTYDLDASGGSPGAIYPVSAAVYNGVLFVAGYDSETGGFQPHLLRHSWLGRNPAAADGFHYLAYAVIGALNEPIMALSPGSSLLLVAKENELYRVSGQGKGIEGWQYAIAQVDNSLGFGCSNARAICHMNGMWYGIGSAGPWRSDGSRVESLLPGRNRSWRSIDQLQLSWVRPHPDRRRIVFGLYPLGSSEHLVAPYRMWLWDIERERWDSDWQSGTTRSYHIVEPIPGSVVVPDAIPTGLQQTFDYGEFMPFFFSQPTAWGKFSSGDVSADTEVWVRMSDADTPVLFKTLEPGIVRFAVDPQYPDNMKRGPYYVKLRHKKSGVPSGFTSEVSFYPPLQPPGNLRVWYSAIGGSHIEVELSNGHEGSDLNVATDPARYSKEWTSAAIGLYQDDATVPLPLQNTLEVFKAWVQDADWPATRQESLVQECQVFYGSSGPVGMVAAPRQQFDSMTEFGFRVVWTATNPGQTYELQFRLFGSSDPWVTADSHTVATGGPALGVARTKFVGSPDFSVDPGTKYEARVVNITNSQASDVVAMYTGLPLTLFASPPVATGNPEVTLTLTVPAGGHDVRIYNCSLSHDELVSAPAPGTLVKTSTHVSCGVGERFFVRTYNSDWPEPWQYSLPTAGYIANPCT